MNMLYVQLIIQYGPRCSPHITITSRIRCAFSATRSCAKRIITNESTSGRKKGAMNAEKSAPAKSVFFVGYPIFAAQMPWPSAAAGCSFLYSAAWRRAAIAGTSGS